MLAHQFAAKYVVCVDCGLKIVWSDRFTPKDSAGTTIICKRVCFEIDCRKNIQQRT